MYKWLWLLLTSYCVAQGPALGIVTSVSGDAQILEPAKKSRPVELADVLQPGTQLTTGRNARVGFVFCPQATAQVMEAGTVLQFSKTGFAAKSGALGASRRVPSCRIPVTSAAATHVGGVDMRGQTNLILISPAGTSVAAEMVKFSWRPVDGASLYRVSLRDDAGEEFWEQEAKEPSLVYSGDRALTAGGNYRWRVTALREDEVLSSASAPFRLLSREESERIQELTAASMSPEERHILLGMLYEELNMPEQALEQYLALKVTPGSWLEGRVASLRTRRLP